jgi:galactokinase
MSDFQDLFGCLPTAAAEAPGRVNLIGEHTDYNGGFVLPTAIPQRTRVELAVRRDRSVSIWSNAVVGAGDIRTYMLGAEAPAKDWLDYIQGVTQLLRDSGHSISGFDARIESNVPLGSGLSSSASLTVSLMRTLKRAFALALDDVQIALLGQRVENEFVGARVGIMDPMAASLADEHTALFLDAGSLAYERVPLPAGMDLLVLHSGVGHQHAGGDYNTRRSECEQACALLGVRQLRDLMIADLPRVNVLPEPLNRRARHVVTENARVLDAVAAIRVANLDRLGELFYASHLSMRNDYEISVPQIDQLIDLARQERDVYGARLTGGGFGGSVVMLARGGTSCELAPRIARNYARRSGCEPKILVPALKSSSPGKGSPGYA